MKLYDVPAPMAHIPMRQPTLNPLQALFVMNSAFVQEQAKAWRSRSTAKRHAGGEDSGAVSEESSRETPRATKWRSACSTCAGADTARYAQALLSTNEVIFWP